MLGFLDLLGQTEELGDPDFWLVGSSYSGPFAAQVLTGDLDGDGHVDLVMEHRGGLNDTSPPPRLEIWRGPLLPGDLAEQSPLSLELPPGSHAQLALCDVDGNGADELWITASDIDSLSNHPRGRHLRRADALDDP